MGERTIVTWGAPVPADDALPTTRAELLAALGRAYNAAVASEPTARPPAAQRPARPAKVRRSSSPPPSSQAAARHR